MQFLESSIVGVRSAVLTMARRASPMRFVLFPMVHVAERSFYDAVAARLPGCALIVAEGAGSNAAPIQRRAARIRFDHLVDETVALDLESLGVPVWWEWAVPESMSPARRFTTVAGDLSATVTGRVFGRHRDPRDIPNLDESDFRDDRWEGGRFIRRRRERILDRRDERLTRRLTWVHREHSHRPVTVAVVYGAAHMPAVVDHLRAEFRYFVRCSEWLVVRNARG
jgi:hypothetical protein